MIDSYLRALQGLLPDLASIALAAIAVLAALFLFTLGRKLLSLATGEGSSNSDQWVRNQRQWDRYHRNSYNGAGPKGYLP